MIRVLENYSRMKTLDLPVGLGNYPVANLQEVGTYTISFSYVVHSGEVTNFLLLGASSAIRIPPSEGRISATFEVDASNIGSNLILYSDKSNAEGQKNHVTFHDVHIARGAQGADIWTTAHADLTSEQIALMKYGDFEEAKQI